MTETFLSLLEKRVQVSSFFGIGLEPHIRDLPNLPPDSPWTFAGISSGNQPPQGCNHTQPGYFRAPEVI